MRKNPAPKLCIIGAIFLVIGMLITGAHAMTDNVGEMRPDNTFGGSMLIIGLLFLFFGGVAYIMPK